MFINRKLKVIYFFKSFLNFDLIFLSIVTTS